MSASEKYKNTDFSFRLKELLKKQGITQVDLAQHLSVSQAAVSGWFNGSVPRGDKLMRLAEVLDVTPAELLTGEDSDTRVGRMVSDANEYAQALGQTDRERQLLKKMHLEQSANQKVRLLLQETERERDDLLKCLRAVKLMIDSALGE